ncbi:MAG: site-specific integrase [Oscillospiraceae bacterium]|nr:site-specific integrase [Oscillospiraceae bacterium]
MAERRKDNKVRVLRTGESQRKDLLYQFRYTDGTGKRQTVYANNLPELREKEQSIEKARYEGLDYEAGKITVLELMVRYIDLKRNLKAKTRDGYKSTITALQNSDLASKFICDVKQSDVKHWFIELNEKGRSYNTILKYRSVIKPAFQMAYDERAILRNPFNFSLQEILRNETEAREALTPAQQLKWLEFISSDNCYKKHYDQYVFLLETGLRISEFCGLTIDDLDFDARTILVERQLVKLAKGKLAIEKPKSDSGTRIIPMTDTALTSLKALLANRPKVTVEPVVDGISGFVLLARNGHPMTSNSFGNTTRSAREKYLKMHPDEDFPVVTPHVFRHTFCSNMANAGMNPKSLQYIMGHSSISLTLNHYAHTDCERAAQQMEKLKFRSTVASTKGRKSKANKEKVAQ